MIIPMWKSDKIYPISHSSLVDLIENRIPAVRIQDFASTDQVKGLLSELLSHSCRTRSIKEVTRFGISQYEQGLRVSKDNYFDLSSQVGKTFREIFSHSFSPVQKVIDHFRALDFNADVMQEPDFGPYFAGNGKLRNGFSPIHVDYAPQDSDGWAIAKSKAQLAWNLYLRIPPQGGELLLWDKLWQVEDDIYQVDNHYFYNEEVVNGARMLRVKVRPGEVIIINSRNFHAITEAEDRLAFGSFISVFDDNSLRLWS